MNRLLLSFIGILTAFGSYSQSYSVQTNDTTLYGMYDQNTFYGDIDITNTGSSTISIIWEKIEEVVPVGWEVSNCDPVDCHPVGTTSASFNLTTSTPGFVNTHFYPNNIAGSGYIRIKVYNSANPGDSTILTFHGNANSAAAIQEASIAKFGLLPNPAHDFINVIGSNLSNKRVDIYNTLGKRIYSKPFLASKIDISSFKPGAYLVKIDGVVKRFVKR